MLPHLSVLLVFLVSVNLDIYLNQMKLSVAGEGDRVWHSRTFREKNQISIGDSTPSSVRLE